MTGIEKTVGLIRKNKNFLITTHTNLEGDALGSELAFYNLLKKLGKKAKIINGDDVPEEYRFLPGINNLNKLKKKFKEPIRFDCFVALDCSDLRRTGEVYLMNKENKTILNIDHHISNERFGDVNWIEPYASSCSEMVYRLYKKMRIPIDRDTAICLYVGILTDTGSFKYKNTTSFTHRAAAELLKYGIDVPQIYKNIYGNIPFQDMKFLSTVLPKIKRQAQGRIAWFQIERRMLKGKNLTFDLSENLLSFARSIKNVEVAVLFKENLGRKNEIRVNLRSQGKVDVNKIASFFGGGGHKTASGATVIGKIDSVRRKVLSKIKKYLG